MKQVKQDPELGFISQWPKNGVKSFSGFHYIFEPLSASSVTAGGSLDR